MNAPSVHQKQPPPNTALSMSSPKGGHILSSSVPELFSWVGIIVSLAIISGIVAVGLFLFKKSRNPETLSGLNSVPDAPLEAPSLPDWD